MKLNGKAMQSGRLSWLGQALGFLNEHCSLASIASNYLQIWVPNYRMSFAVSSIVSGVCEQKSTVHSVPVDDWTAE